MIFVLLTSSIPDLRAVSDVDSAAPISSELLKLSANTGRALGTLIV